MYLSISTEKLQFWKYRTISSVISVEFQCDLIITIFRNTHICNSKRTILLAFHDNNENGKWTFSIENFCMLIKQRCHEYSAIIRYSDYYAIYLKIRYKTKRILSAIKPNTDIKWKKTFNWKIYLFLYSHIYSTFMNNKGCFSFLKYGHCIQISK